MASRFNGKQIVNASLNLGTKGVAGSISADVAGRALFAANFFDSATFDAKVADGAIPLDKLAEAVIQADGGQAFTADQPMGGFKITGLGDGTSAGDAVSRSQLDAAVVRGVTWKELILTDSQLLDGGSGAILQAMLAYISVNVAAGDTFIITDGVVTETFTFIGAEVAPFDVLVGASAADSLTNLIAAINDDSTLWSAIATAGLDKYFAGSPASQMVVFRTAYSANNDRIYGTIAGGQDDVKVVSFAGATQDYASTSGTEANLPVADPAAKRFGFGRAFASLVGGNTHKVASDNTEYLWDADDAVWQQTGLGTTGYGTSTQPVGVVGAAGTSPLVSRQDHVHETCVPLLEDMQNPTGNGTGVDEFATGITLAWSPALSQPVVVFLNGIKVVVGDGVKTTDCYFSADGGTTARTYATTVATDQLIWNAVVAGYDVTTSDEFDFLYETF